MHLPITMATMLEIADNQGELEVTSRKFFDKHIGKVLLHGKVLVCTLPEFNTPEEAVLAVRTSVLEAVHFANQDPC